MVDRPFVQTRRNPSEAERTQQELLIRAADKLRQPEQFVFREAHVSAHPNMEPENFKFHWDRYLRDGTIPQWVTDFCVTILEE
jgi:hypothetical protein